MLYRYPIARCCSGGWHQFYREYKTRQFSRGTSTCITINRAINSTSKIFGNIYKQMDVAILEQCDSIVYFCQCTIAPNKMPT